MGNPLEEVFQSLSAFQIIEEGLDGHSGSAEYRRAVHDLGVPGNRLRHVSILAQTGIASRGRSPSTLLPDGLIHNPGASY